jgi:epoxyqueuosine reductase
MPLTDDIKHKALELGFDLVGITDASPLNPRQAEFLSRWLKAGYAGQMTYLHRNLEKRIDPVKLLPNAQSVIVVALNYKPPLLSSRASPPIGKVTTYAQYEDYHPFIKNRLRKLSNFIISITDKNVQFKICVDSAPLSERAFAVRASLGFIGKNHLLIHPQLGPQLFLGEILTTLKLQPDQLFPRHSERNFCHSESGSGVVPDEESRRLIPNNCATCNKCITACPTGALTNDGFLDANRCINYLTIEYKGQIPSDLSQKIRDRLFGCDDCILACPYQQNAPPCKNKDFKFYADRANLNLHNVLALTEESFKTQFADSVIKRPGLARLKQNAQICLANITSQKTRKLKV